MVVRFPVSNPVVLRDLVAKRQRIKTIQGKGYLYRPKAASGPGPAVVILQGLGGLIKEREHRYGRFLADRGYTVLVISTFEARNAAVRSHGQRALRVTKAMMLADAFGALRHLARMPTVDPGRVHVLGFSYGGMVSVLCAYDQIARLYAPGDLRFASHTSYYGSSVPRLAEPQTTGAPVMMMLGGRDRNVCTDRSERIAHDLTRGGSAVAFHVFDDAFHQWDSVDLEPRFVRFSLVNCHLLIGDDDLMRNERDGRVLTNRYKRALALARSVDWDGYYIQRNEAVAERSDDALIGFLARTDARPATVARDSGVRAAIPSGAVAAAE